MAPVQVIRNVINSHFEEASGCYPDLIATANSKALSRYRRELHQRLMANLEGLLLSGDYAWPLCRQYLETEDINVGEHFVIAFLAFELNDIRYVKSMLEHAFTDAVFFRATSDALCWRPWQKCRFWATQFIRSGEINDQLLGFQAFRYHQQQAPLALPALIEHTFNNGKHQGARNFLLNEVITPQDIEKDQAQLTLLGSYITDELTPGNFNLLCKYISLGGIEVISQLQPYMFRENINQENAVAFAFSHISEPRTSQWFDLLKGQKNAIRLLLVAIGAMADEQYLDWVLAQMDSPEHARLAGKTFSLLTGIDLNEKGWTLNSAGLDELWLESDLDDALDWPDKAKIIAGLANSRDHR